MMLFGCKKKLAKMAARLEQAERREKAALSVYDAHRRKIARLERLYARAQHRAIALRRGAGAQGKKKA